MALQKINNAEIKTGKIEQKKKNKTKKATLVIMILADLRYGGVPRDEPEQLPHSTRTDDLSIHSPEQEPLRH